MSDTPKTDALVAKCLRECSLNGEPIWTEAALAADPFVAHARQMEYELTTADQMVDIFLSEAEKCPQFTDAMPDAWTDWITTVLKNCGFWQYARDKRGE